MGNNEIIRVQQRVHERTLQARAFERLVMSQDFVEVYKDTDELRVILESGDPERLKQWIKVNRKLELGEMSYRELRELCKHHNIPRWSRLDTLEMMEALSAIKL